MIRFPWEVVNQHHLSHLCNYNFTDKKKIRWRKREIEAITDDIWVSDIYSVDSLLAPIDYFLQYVPNSLFSSMAEKTNIYALQSSKTKFKPTTADELKTHCFTYSCWCFEISSSKIIVEYCIGD